MKTYTIFSFRIRKKSLLNALSNIMEEKLYLESREEAPASRKFILHDPVGAVFDRATAQVNPKQTCVCLRSPLEQYKTRTFCIW